MTEPADLYQFYQLVGAHCEDMLTAEQAAKLQAMLLQDAELRARYILCMHIQAVADRSLASSLPASDGVGAASAFSATANERSQIESSSGQLRSPILGFLRNLGRLGTSLSGEMAGGSFFQWSVLGMIGAGMVAIVVMAAVLVSGRFGRVNPGERDARQVAARPGPAEASGLSSEAQPSLRFLKPQDSSLKPPVREYAARLIRVADAHWLDREDDLQPGADLFTGRRMRLDSGVALFYFQGGAEVILHGPAHIVFLSRTSARLVYGSLTVTVEDPLSRGFELHTPGMKFTDLGTEFGVRVSRDGKQEMHVFRGHVSAEEEGIRDWGLGIRAHDTAFGGAASSNPQSLIPNPLPAPLILAANQAIEIAGPGKPSEQISADEKKFVRREQLAKIVAEQSPEFRRWKAFHDELCKRTDLVAYYDFQPDESDRTILRNRATTGSQFDGRILGGAEWVEGRLRGKKALWFDKRGSGVRVTFPASYKQLSLVAWLKLDRKDRHPHGFFLSDSWLHRAGSLHWQYYEDGTFGYGVSLVDKVDQPERTQFAMPIAQWTMCAITYDADSSSGSFYCDGALAGSSPLAKKIPVQIGSATIGSFRAEDARLAGDDRMLHGRIDELTIFDTSLPAEEIHRIYSAQTPAPVMEK